MSVVLVEPLTSKERLYVRYRIEGLEKKQAALKAGFSPSMAHNATWRIETPEMLAMIESAQKELTARAVERGLVNSVEILEVLTDEIRGDLADLYSDTGELLPIKEWPLWARQGGVEVTDEPNMVHSADGGGGSWDQVGRKIRIRAGSRQKTIENAMQHKAVDAKVKQHGDTNIVIVTPEQQRQSRLERARQRLTEVIDVKAEEA